jgi:multidrug efflux system outer membrane protein
VLQFRQSVLNAVGEVSDALVKIEKLKTRAGIAANRVKPCNRQQQTPTCYLKMVWLTYLEVITAQSNVLQGELELATVKRTQLDAVSALYRSLGGGWK